MKNLELNQMENLEGGREGYLSGFACGFFVLSMFATAGTSALIGGYLGAIACGAALGIELN